jgi:hypothetical protein
MQGHRPTSSVSYTCWRSSNPPPPFPGWADAPTHRLAWQLEYLLQRTRRRWEGWGGDVRSDSEGDGGCDRRSATGAPLGREARGGARGRHWGVGGNSEEEPGSPEICRFAPGSCTMHKACRTAHVTERQICRWMSCTTGLGTKVLNNWLRHLAVYFLKAKKRL